MPDWSYHPLFKPLLFALPVPRARQITLSSIQAVQRLPGGRFFIELFGGMKPPASLHRIVSGVEFPSAVGMSGLVDPNLTATPALSNFGFGFIVVGPIKSAPQPPVQVILDAHTETITYHPDLECTALETTMQRLNRQSSTHIPRIIHISGENPEDIIRQTAPYAKAFILEGTIDAYQAAKEITADVPIFFYLKRDSYTTLSTLRDIGNVDGVFLDDRVVTESGILFGREAKSHVIRWMHEVKLALPDVPVMCCAGIYEPQDALDVLQEGADLIVVQNGLIFSGPGLPKRINEAILDERRSVPVSDPKRNPAWVAWFLMGLGVMVAGLIALFLGLSDVIVGYDEKFLGISRSEIVNWNPNLFHFMSHDRVTLAGIMISAGLLYSLLAFNKVRRGERWTVRVFKVAGILGFLNFFYFLFFGYLDFLHLIYNLLIFPLFALGWVFIPSSTDAHASTNRRNTSEWFTGLIGQFLFVVLGVGVLAAGLIISLVGMTYVYIDTDISFLCTTPSAIHTFNQHLTPLIAHDRAGLGGALISEGLILLLTSLWGYREGERWLWWGYCLGGVAALVPAIGIHFLIGYTTFSHLLPAYFACLVFVAGLAFSYRYLCDR